MQIKFEALQTGDIKFLQDKECLYAVDFRATGEELTRNIDAMFKYENESIWLGGFTSGNSKRHIVVNETAPPIDQSLYEAHLALRVIEQSHISVFKRLKTIPTGIKSIWTAIPHPDAESLASKNDLKLNVTYQSFLKANDKITQKKILEEYTPTWKQFESNEDLLKAALESQGSYLKRRLGAGGFSVFKLSADNVSTVQKALQNVDPTDWYIEEGVLGEPQSVQALIDRDGMVVIFGVTKQKIVNDTIYAGATIYDVSIISEPLRDSISSVVRKLQPILRDYVGFFGIDFIINKDGIKVLECNIRMTSASIPTLLRNKMGTKVIATYAEDRSGDEVLPDEILLAADELHHENDTLSFTHPNTAETTSTYFDTSTLADELNETHLL